MKFSKDEIKEMKAPMDDAPLINFEREDYKKGICPVCETEGKLQPLSENMQRKRVMSICPVCGTIFKV